MAYAYFSVHEHLVLSAATMGIVNGVASIGRIYKSRIVNSRVQITSSSGKNFLWVTTTPTVLRTFPVPL